MTPIDHLPTVTVRPGAPATDSPSTDLEAADQLIADLTALVDAGLVTVRRQLGGPVRYGAAVEIGDPA